MNKHQFNLKSANRFLGLILSLVLSFPNPALALRQSGLEESKSKKDLVTTLLTSNGPDAAVQGLFERATRAAPSVGFSPSTQSAGLEEQVRRAFLGELHRLNRNLWAPIISFLQANPTITDALIQNPTRTDLLGQHWEKVKQGKVWLGL